MTLAQIISAIALVGLAVGWLVKFADGISKLRGSWDWIEDRLRKTTVPIKLGMHRTTVREKLGHCSKSTSNGDVFAQHGIRAFYSAHDVLDGISVSRPPYVAEFTGKLTGIRIGEPYASCVKKLGVPENWGTPAPSFSIAVWERGPIWIVAEIWRERPPEPVFADIKLQTVKTISMVAKNSTSIYCVIVSLAIEFIRNGSRPIHLEEGFVGDVDLRAPFFLHPYDFLTFQKGIMGGVQVAVKFESSPVVIFWIYALSGVNPVIRGIYFANPTKAAASNDEKQTE